MAAFQDIAAELSKLTNEISSAEITHGEVDFYIYKVSDFTTILSSSRGNIISSY